MGEIQDPSTAVTGGEETDFVNYSRSDRNDPELDSVLDERISISSQIPLQDQDPHRSKQPVVINDAEKRHVRRKMSSLNFSTLRLPSKAKFWKKRSVVISDYDPTFRVVYLGNVLTGWAKGDGCVDKPLSTLWRNHVGSEKPDIVMKVTVCAQGLKAVTKEHGLTEYWAHRITFCAADPAYPKVFCWIYRHEGRKMKQELRCHAVLCPSEEKANAMADKLKDRLHQALIDFKKEKISRQNARLSLANAAYDNPSMPYRKILLQTGSSNYRPPMDRSKSAPKLKVIEEVISEEEEDEDAIECHSDVESYDFSIPSGALGGSVEEEDEFDSSNTDCQISSHPCEEEEEFLVHPRLGTSGSERIRAAAERMRLEDDDSDVDEVTNYLDKPPEVDSAASVSPDSNQFSTRSSSKERRSGDTDSFTEEAFGALRLADQDTISDESGYSEESSTREALSAKLSSDSGKYSISRLDKQDDDSGDEETTVCDITVEVHHEDNEDEARAKAEAKAASDLSVKSVMMSEFTTSEKLKYIERSRRSREIFQNKIPEFCINI